MKNAALGIVSAVLLAGLLLQGASFVRAQAAGVSAFTGEIMDSTCAKNNNHDDMKDMPSMGGTAASCTLSCVEMGAKYVLQDTAKKVTYQLDDQSKPKDFAGQKVKITGSFDAKTKTIHVEKIEAAEGK
jgi:type 1 fimbria pilin